MYSLNRKALVKKEPEQSQDLVKRQASLLYMKHTHGNIQNIEPT